MPSKTNVSLRWAFNVTPVAMAHVVQWPVHLTHVETERLRKFGGKYTSLLRTPAYRLEPYRAFVAAYRRGQKRGMKQACAPVLQDLLPFVHKSGRFKPFM